MINPYAHSFMIAARTEHLITPKLREIPSHNPPRRRLRLFRRARKTDPGSL